MFELEQEIESTELARSIALVHKGEVQSIAKVCSFENSKKGALSFLTSPVQVNICGTLIAQAYLETLTTTVLLSESPRLDFVHALNFLNKQVGFKKCMNEEISSSAKVHSSAIVEDGVSVGDNSIVEPFAYIKSGTIIGDNCLIKSGARIGHAGFGFENSNDGVPIHFPHLGKVAIGNNVEVGCNTTIAKGVLKDTVIKSNVKIDDQVYIAHNCEIGENTLLVSGSTICGSVQVGKNVFVGAGASVKQHCRLGDNSTIGMGSIITNSVAKNEVVVGNPARVLRVN